jgi:hypothetical protein
LFYLSVKNKSFSHYFGALVDPSFLSFASKTRRMIVKKINLPINIIGDILVLGSKNIVFSPVRKGEIENVALRSPLLLI